MFLLRWSTKVYQKKTIEELRLESKRFTTCFMFWRLIVDDGGQFRIPEQNDMNRGMLLTQLWIFE